MIRKLALAALHPLRLYVYEAYERPDRRGSPAAVSTGVGRASATTSPGRSD